MQSRESSFLTAASIAAILASTGLASPSLELVIKNSDPTGIAGTLWTTSSAFQSSTIDNSGNVGVRGTLLTGTGGVTSSNNATMWYGAPGSLGLVARTGSQAPGLPGGVNSLGLQSQNLNLSPNGNMWFGGTTTAPSGYVATGPFGSLAKVARNGETLPGVAAALSVNPASTSIYQNVTNAGQTIISAGMADSTNGLWVGDSSSLSLAWQSGQSYTGLPSGTTTKGALGAYMINGSGTLYSPMIANQNAGAGVTDQNNESLTTHAYGSSTFTELAREGGLAPGAGGATYTVGLFNSILGFEDSSFFVNNGNFNNAGYGVFSAGLSGTGVVGTTNNAAIFYHDGTNVSMLRRRGDSTNAVTGATYALTNQQCNNTRINNNNDVIMTMQLTSGVGGVTTANDQVLLRTSIGSSVDTLIAREGSAVPGVAGALWGNGFGSLIQNNAGTIVFTSTMLDDASNPSDNVSASNDLGLFMWDPTVGLSLIAREGDSLASIGANLTITGNGISLFNMANAEGGANALSDTGWLTFRATGTALPGFSDNTAVIRTQIPAPGSALVLAIGGAALIRRRRIA